MIKLPSPPKRDGPESIAELERLRADAMRFLPKAA
jgi:hypothetical protein